jgi:hypothetical protein
MVVAYNLKRVAPNVKLFVIKLAQCKQSGILTYIQNTKTL